MTIEILPDHLRPCSSHFRDGVPSHLGRRYDSSGRFLTERGNTVVCHLASGSESERAIAAARQRYLETAEAQNLAFTAETSLHMTLFKGIIDSRRERPFWAHDVPVETPVDDMTAIFIDRLAGFEPGPVFQMEVTHATPLGLVLDGVSMKDRAALKAWRDRLSDLLGYRHPDHDAYVFHITFAYMLRYFDDAEILRWQPFLDQIVADIRQRAPIIELKAPAFCAFDDMNHFEELLVFSPETLPPAV
uniref:DUF1868 domain-containing protein n=1 Tax=uncultured Rhizobium sp. TaxID=155567 RepID=UPI00260F33A0|nr:DUF1868 domain-containing protein [uncultured Rhizobium sp.]